MTAPSVNRQVLLASRPDGIPQAEHFRIVKSAVPVPGPGQVLVRNAYLSVEPAMRGWVAAVANYSEPVAIGAVMRSFAAGYVVVSNDASWPVGTPVTGLFGWQDYAAVDAASIERRVDETDLPLSTALGVLGINGVTAHHGLLRSARRGQARRSSSRPRRARSAPASARSRSCRASHRRHRRRPGQAYVCLERFGYDAAVDYKAADFAARLTEACPNGVDVYFDNTSGPISDAVLTHLNVGARIVVCGTASVANWNPWPQGPRVERHLLVKRARMQGFVIFDHPEAARRRAPIWRAGSAPGSCAISRRCSTASSRRRTRSPGYIAARTSASG